MNSKINSTLAALFLSVTLLPTPSFAASASDATATAFPTRLYLSKAGVALSAFPSHPNLTRTLNVMRTVGSTSVSWTASSNQPWLKVTASGTTSGMLTLQANTKGLNKDQLYLATITVSTAANSEFADTQSLPVSLWIGAQSPTNVDFKRTVTALATNPVLPYVYVSAGGSTIDVYNVYTAKLVTSFPHIAPTVGALTVSGDGQFLFAADYTNYRIAKLNAVNGTKLSQFNIGQKIGPGFSMVYARPFGIPAIYPAGGKIFSVETNTPLTSTPLTKGFIAVTPDGRNMYSVDLGISPGTLTGYKVTDNGGSLKVASFGSSFISGENCQDLAVSDNGAHVYPACGYPYEFDVYSGKTLLQVQTLPAAPYPNNAEIDAKGRFVGGIDGIYEAYDVFVYGQNGYAISKVATVPDQYANGQNSNVLAVSGDTSRVISATNPVFGKPIILFRNLQ
ncbi:MAG: hypothetical protein PHU14_01955 [Methylovulum sp.]|nr:hypothetical protein [Methylovulum sp.]